MPKPPKAPKPKKDRKLNVDLLCKMAGKETEREVPLPDGTKLEARTANLRRAKVAVLLCPPLPPNGNCYAPEVGCLQAALALDGYCTVRFNFRGVGKSTGSTYFRSPQRECDDVRDVCRWLHAYRKHLGEEPLQSVWVAGVSYGSCIGSAAAGLYDEFSGYVAVSYPASYLWYCCNLQGDTFLEYARTPKPKLFLSGDVDVFAGKKATEDVVKSMPAPVYHVSCPTLDSTLGHYFRRHEDLEVLRREALAFFRKHAPTPGLDGDPKARPPTKPRPKSPTVS